MVKQIVFNDGDLGTNTEHFKIDEGDHDWPCVWGNMDIDASSEIWRFFSRYNINGLFEGSTVGVEKINETNM